MRLVAVWSLTGVATSAALALSACAPTEIRPTASASSPTPTSTQVVSPAPTPEVPEDSVYVSVTGDDANLGERSSPVRTIGRAIEIAKTTLEDSVPENDLTNVRVADGDYAEDVVVAPGLNLLGGHDPDDWEVRDPDVFVTRITGVPALVARDLELPTTVSGFRLIGPSVCPTNTDVCSEELRGESVIALQVVRSPGLVLTDNVIVAGDGAPGAGGLDGLAGADGVAGNAGANVVIASTGRQVAGPGGGSVSGPCGEGSGAGGFGGKDTPFTNGTAGKPGSSTAVISGGAGGAKGVCPGGTSTCAVTGRDGQSGTLNPMAQAGLAGTGLGAFVDGVWVGDPGTDGTLGSDGTSGAGGGGGGGHYEQIVISTWGARALLDAPQTPTLRAGEAGRSLATSGSAIAIPKLAPGTPIVPVSPLAPKGGAEGIGGTEIIHVYRAGAGGGSGGTGGCAGTPGTGGLAGGASIGLILVDSAETVMTGNRIESGFGGTGGRGGDGGAGGMGGVGGAGGIHPQGAEKYRRGGPGGEGAPGEDGGPGGGGSGGISVPVLIVGDGPADLSLNNTLVPGIGGDGGAGGTSETLAAEDGASGYTGAVLELD